MVLGVLSILAIIIVEEEKNVVALLCVLVVCVLYLFLTVPWVGPQSVIVAFPAYNYLLYEEW